MVPVEGEDAARALAEMIADAASRRQRGEAIPDQDPDATRLIIELGAAGDFDRFFDLLGAGLRARGATLPAIEELPPSVAPLVAAAAEAFVVDDRGRIDYQATADRLDGVMVKAFGKSPRQAREDALAARIRREVAASVAQSMRDAGLTPARDMPDDAADDD